MPIDDPKRDDPIVSGESPVRGPGLPLPTIDIAYQNFRFFVFLKWNGMLSNESTINIVETNQAITSMASMLTHQG
ncbi:MAG: hypothetical protein V4554_04175 [Pseudomonadota bacterium]